MRDSTSQHLDSLFFQFVHPHCNFCSSLDLEKHLMGELLWKGAQ
jgi:hypothetical protein